MKKIPTLFERQFENHKITGILPKPAEGLEWVLDKDRMLKGEIVPTVKYDGSCCALIDGLLYVRYDAKRGKKPPEGAIPCCEPDPVTGHHPHWVRADGNPAYKWYARARDYFFSDHEITKFEEESKSFKEVYKIKQDYKSVFYPISRPITFEAVGKHFNGNPYGLDFDTLIEHGNHKIDVSSTKNELWHFDGIRKYLEENNVEGIVFWIKCDLLSDILNEPVCKIKRTDFGLPWNNKK